MKYILFDLDGTLTDPKEGITKCVQYALKAFGIEREADELMCFIGPPLKEQFMAYANMNEEEAVKAVEKYRERFAPIGVFENRAYDGAVEMLEKLKNEGKILALATSKPQIFADQIIKKYGIEPYLSVSVGSELDGTRTRKSEVIEEAIRRLGADKEDCIMIGDREHDIIGAKEAGIKSVGVRFGYAAQGELENAGADYIVDDIISLTELLLRL